MHLGCRLLLEKKKLSWKDFLCLAGTRSKHQDAASRAGRGHPRTDAEASYVLLRRRCRGLIFFFNDRAPTEIYTLSLHDALPIWQIRLVTHVEKHGQDAAGRRNQIQVA